MSPVISRRSSVNPNSGIGFRQSYIIRSAAGGVGITTSFVARSLRFNSGDSAYLSRTNVSSPTTDTKCTFSAWVKRANLNTGQVLIGGRGSGFFDYFGFSSTFSAYDGLEFRDGNSGAWKVRESHGVRFG